MTANAKERIDLVWGQRTLDVDLRRTNRRVLRIEVKPTGEVVVHAPTGETLDAVRLRLNKKCHWIFRQLDKIAGRPVRTPPRHFVSGETHLLLGKSYRLSLEQSEPAGISVRGDRLCITTPHVDDGAERHRLLMAFYVSEAKSIFRDRLEAMAPPFLRKGLELPRLMIRHMTRRWGSFTSRGRIILNVDLVRASPLLIDYVICHELAHAFHHDHGKDWRDLLSMVMPDWESRKARLETVLR